MAAESAAAGLVAAAADSRLPEADSAEAWVEGAVAADSAAVDLVAAAVEAAAAVDLAAAAVAAAVAIADDLKI